jgi:hypothetical protein
MTNPGRSIKDIFKATLAQTGKRFGPPDGWLEAVDLAEAAQLNVSRHSREVDAFQVGTIGGAVIAGTVGHLRTTAVMVGDAKKLYHSTVVRINGTASSSDLWKNSRYHEVMRLGQVLNQRGWSDDDVQAYLDAVSRDVAVLEQNMKTAKPLKAPFMMD